MNTKETTDLAKLLTKLPGYPARLSPASDGGAWLALFAPRNRLIEFILLEHEYRSAMMREIDRPYWIAPALSSGDTFLEPLQAGPVIIEDNAFIGARSEVAEGVIVGTGAVLSMGVFIGASTKIVDRATGEVHMGKVPPYAVVVPGSLPGKPLPDGTPGPSLYCAVIVKTVDAQTRSKTGINELLRD